MFQNFRWFCVISLVATFVCVACTPVIVAPQQSTTATPVSPPSHPTTAGSSAIPQFSNSLTITNPYYPIAPGDQTLSLGTEDGKPERVEVTVLPDVKTITWSGGETKTQVVQFVAYSDDNLIEVTYDYLAQSDNGDVYYFGEEVSSYEDGQVTSHEGSWLAGKDGAPPALLMPAKPMVGMMFNPENVPGVAFETDEVITTSEPVTTPAGPSSAGLLIKETLMDGSIEHKVHVAGWGIVEDRAEDEKTSLVLFHHGAAKPQAVPEALQTIEAQAEDIIDNAPGGNWAKIQAAVTSALAADKTYQAQAANDKAPQVFVDALAATLQALEKAASAKDAHNTMQTANDVSAALMDLFVVYQPAIPADIGRLDVLERQVVLDVAEKDFQAAADSLAKVETLWVRLKPLILQHNGAKVATQFDASLTTQQTAGKNKDAAAVTAEAQNGLELVDALEELYN
ncbi:MAG: hypothetical protein U0350_18705 [Caldilineaceae bacterium]